MKEKWLNTNKVVVAQLKLVRNEQLRKALALPLSRPRKPLNHKKMRRMVKRMTRKEMRKMMAKKMERKMMMLPRTIPRND